jgi:hypothetical protein
MRHSGKAELRNNIKCKKKPNMMAQEKQQRNGLCKDPEVEDRQ